MPLSDYQEGIYRYPSASAAATTCMSSSRH